MRSALKCLLFLPVFIFFLVFIKTPAYAAEPQIQPTNQYLAPVTNPGVPQNLHTYTQSVFIEVLATLFCQLTGIDPLSYNHKCLGIDPNSHKIGFVENSGGLIGATGGLIAMTYSMPTSSSQFVNYMASNFGVTKKAYAANPCALTANNEKNGVGFCSLQPLTEIWRNMRDIVYLLFTVIFIVIGLAIMLRVQIDPRTVMTLENQIPKIIIGIILVTFSLAIAGFLIDIMYVAIYLIGNVLNQIATDIPSSPLPDFLNNNYNPIATSGSPIGAAMSGLGNNTNIVWDVANAITTLIANNVHSVFDVPIIGDIGALLVKLILFIIFAIAFWIALIRVWIALIVAYVMILLDIIFAPFWFLAGLLPGGSLGFGPWFRDILANLAVFPATIAMFALAIIFSHIGKPDVSPDLFNPPLVGSAGSSLEIGQIIAFGFIFMTPQALTIVKAAVKAPKFNFGQVFAPTGAAVSVIRSSTSAGMSYGKTAGDELNKEKGFRRVFRKVVG